MCNFLSALGLRNGDVLTHPMLDSHSDLVRYFKLHDNTAYLDRFAKVELTPRGSATITNVGGSASITNVGGSATLDASAKAKMKP